MVWGYHLRDYGWTPLSQNPARICDDSFRSFCVGRQRYETRSRSQPQLKVFAALPISADGGLTNIHPMRRGGVKSFVDDLVLGRGVVISRAATSLRSVETQPLTRRFVRIRRATISVGHCAVCRLSLSLLLLRTPRPGAWCQARRPHLSAHLSVGILGPSSVAFKTTLFFQILSFIFKPHSWSELRTRNSPQALNLSSRVHILLW